VDNGAIPRRVYWLILHLAIVVAFARHLWAPLVDRDELGSTDFAVFYTGWSLVLKDPARTYDVEAQRRVQADLLRGRQFQGGVMTFYYPPPAAVALAPFGWLDFQNAFRLWTLFQVGAAALLLRWLLEAARLESRLDRWILATAVLGFLPLLYALQIGQMSIVMTLALLGFWRAFASARDAEAGAWLLVLSAKPQLLPVPLLLLAATRRWRPVAWLAAWAAPLVAAAAVVLGPRAFLEYPGRARKLEGFVAGGSHDHMLNLRGWLTRLAGAGHDEAIFVASALALAAGLIVVYVVLRRFARSGPVPAVAYAGALAIALPVNLHLHLQDALVWVLPLAGLAAELRAGGDLLRYRRFATFALAWPLVFVVTHALELGTGRLAPIPPELVLAAALVVWFVPQLRGRSAARAPAELY
jgi:hypothetical protein